MMSLTVEHIGSGIAVRGGVAELFGKSIGERALALIAIAHPDFRDRLTAQARELHHL